MILLYFFFKLQYWNNFLCKYCQQALRVKRPCRKCKIFVLSFIVSEKIEKKMDDVLAFRLENKRAIHRYRIFSDRKTNLITHIDKCLLK